MVWNAGLEGGSPPPPPAGPSLPPPACLPLVGAGTTTAVCRRTASGWCEALGLLRR